MIDHAHRRLAAFLLMGVLSGAAACDGGGPTEPGSPFDPQATSGAVEGMRSAMDEDSEILIGLELVGASLAEQGVTGAVIPRDLSRPGSSTTMRRTSAGIELSRAGSGAAAPALPAELIGTTFAWDVTAGRYAIDETRTDAPENGIRFVLYAVDPITRRPVEPLIERGWIDLIDEGSAEVTRLVVRATVGGATLVEYFIQASYLAQGQSLTGILDSEGFLSDGTHRLDFDIREAVTATDGAETVGIEFTEDIAAGGQDVSVHLEMSGDIALANGSATELEFELRLDHGPDRVVIAGTLTGETVEGTITHNGRRAAAFSGSAGSPTFTREDGSPLTDADRQALEELSDLVEDLFEFSERLFAPFAGV